MPVFSNHWKRAAVVAQQWSTRLWSKTLKVMGSIPAVCWAFFFSYYLSVVCPYQVPQAGLALMIFFYIKWMLSCAAWGETSIIWADLAKKMTEWKRQERAFITFWFGFKEISRRLRFLISNRDLSPDGGYWWRRFRWEIVFMWNRPIEKMRENSNWRCSWLWFGHHKVNVNQSTFKKQPCQISSDRSL